ncbi:hypothetical protein C1H46_040207 [Malus baccata]|uniref:Uncharacterized protein n=1 Tax=Malus baccata TaxID=106549 RepID=A0A540KJ80_MALBA|nr:hypothetical protein C1H46_040207 [Malus baccata]
MEESKTRKSGYGLPLPHTLVSLFVEDPTSLPQGVEYEFQTLPVIETFCLQVDAKAIQDGDLLTVYVSTEDPRESSFVPTDVQTAAIQRSKARAVRDYTKADALRQKIKDAGYGLDIHMPLA